MDVTNLKPLLFIIPFKHWEISHPKNRMLELG